MKYTRIAILLHWLSAGLILALLALGPAMKRLELELGLKFELYQLHKSLGFTLLTVLCLRLIWRALNKPPPYAASISDKNIRLAGIIHTLMYTFLLIMPLTGWAVVSVAEFKLPTLYFGLFEIPHLSFLDSNAEFWRTLSGWMHTLLAAVLAILLVGHIGAALMHTLILKDDLLKRMLP